jgi:homoserine dehydrogenase
MPRDPPGLRAAGPMRLLLAATKENSVSDFALTASAGVLDDEAPTIIPFRRLALRASPELRLRSDAERGLGPAVRVVRIGLLGLGRVGQAVARACEAARPTFHRRGIDLRIEAALVRDETKPRALNSGEISVTANPLAFFGRKFDVVVETIGGVTPAFRYVRGLLRAGVPVVTANKSLIAARGEVLFRTAARAGTVLHCEASAIAGVPFLTTLRRRPLATRVTTVAGVLNGTSNFILSELAGSRGSFGEAVSKAQKRGYAEPDPAFDVSGRDAAEKLLVTLQHLDVGGVRLPDIETTGIDRVSPVDLRQAQALGGAIKPVAYARMDRHAIHAFVGPALVPLAHPLSAVSREYNGICLTGPEIGRLVFTGPGAGPDVTAGTILDDVFEIVSRFAAGPAAQPRPTAPELADDEPDDGEEAPPTRPVVPPETEWFIRFRFGAGATRFVAVTGFLESRGVVVRQISGAPPTAQGDHLYVIVAAASREKIENILLEFRQTTGSSACALRVLPHE